MIDTNIQHALASALSRALGIRPSIQGLRRLSGGASQETWAFEAEHGADSLPLVLRRSPGGVSPSGERSAIGLREEARIIERVRANGAAAPHVLAVLEPEDGAGDGYIMARLEGETLPKRILRGPQFAMIRPQLAVQCGRALASIHSTPLGDDEALPLLDGPAQLLHYRALYDRYDQPRPIFELAFTWLESALRPVKDPVLVHGDFRHGNLMIDARRGLVAALDWELAHRGDAAEDLAWLCVNSWRFGCSERRVGGFGDLPDLLEAYAEAGGRDVSQSEVTIWEVFGVLKWGIGCTSMYEAFRSGFDRSVERAAIGRRASECEIDLMNLLLEHA